LGNEKVPQKKKNEERTGGGRGGKSANPSGLEEKKQRGCLSRESHDLIENVFKKTKTRKKKGGWETTRSQKKKKRGVEREKHTGKGKEFKRTQRRGKGFSVLIT